MASLSKLQRKLEELKHDESRFQQDIETLTGWIQNRRAIIIEVEAEITALGDESFARIPRRLSPGLRARIFSGDDWTCQYCGAKDTTLEVDHDIPVARGGNCNIDNLVTACEKCNRSKNTMTGDEYRAKLAKENRNE